jgi:hypothetical protein
MLRRPLPFSFPSVPLYSNATYGTLLFIFIIR